MYLTNLADVCRRSGLKVVEVGGWKSRGRGPMRGVRTITCHHTATPRSLRRSSDYPTMNVVKNGRRGLPGPLAQLGLGRNGTVYVIAAGRANHAGRSRSSSMTNSYAIGIEAEGAMEAWPKQQYDAYVRLVAALSQAWPGAQILGHKESASPPGRKNDPSFNMTRFRKDVEAAKRGKPAAAPKTRGFFGMAGYEQYARATPQTVKPGKDRVRVHKNGPHYVARPARRGQKFLLQADVTIENVPAGADVKAQLIVTYYLKGGGHEITRPFEQVSFPAGANGWSSVSLSQVEQFGGTPPGGKRGSKTVHAVEYQVEISNFSKEPVTVRRVRAAAFWE